MTKWEEYSPLAKDSPVTVYRKKKQIPAKYETIGKIEFVCNDAFSKTQSCDSAFVFDAAKTKAREAGGNALLITTHRKPFILDLNYSLDVYVLKIFHPDSIYPVKKQEIHDRGTLDLRLSLPYINFFNLKPDNEKPVLSAGFMGISLGLNYWHRRNQYLSIFAASVTDFLLPVKFVPAYGERKECLSRFAGLTNNHLYKSLSFGYGLSYSYNTWEYFSGDRDEEFDKYADIPPDKRYAGNMLGLMFTVYWRHTIGIIYRPAFICLNSSSPFKHEHYISIDFGSLIRLKTSKKK